MLKTFNCLKGMRSRFKSRSVNFFLLLSVLCLWLIAFPSVVSAQVVDIPDPGLRAAIAEALGKAPGDAITRADMETLVELRAVGRNITNLRGIEFAINLIELDIWRNDLTDISPLSSLINLTWLTLSDNDLMDVSPLSSLTNLTLLTLSRNDLTDISPLSSLTNLTRLYLSDNAITDVSPLSSLTNLTQLYLSNNDLTDILPLSSLTNLTRLNLSRNDLTDISPIANLINLTELYLWSNNISDILPLITLANLEELHISNNAITDISPLSNLINLTELYLSNNNISDLLPLITLANLEQMTLSSNAITNISPLSNLTNLAELYLLNNDISDILPLITLTNLERLHIQGNNISDVETLERLMAQGTVVFFRGNPAFETPGPKIEDGWVWLIVPATDVHSGSAAAGSGRDFLAEASGGAVTEADVAVNGAQAGTRVGDSVWTAARLDASDSNNLGAILRDYNLGRGYRFPVAYGVVPIHSETQQQTRIYIGAGPVKVWLNGTLVYKDPLDFFIFDYETAVPVTLNAGDNVLFIAAYRPNPSTFEWGAFFGLQDDTGAPDPGSLDVNGDGEVTVIDLAIVALFYGTQVPSGIDLPADVNADGIVNILDLTAVAQGIDADSRNAFTPDELEAALVAAVEIEAIAEAPMPFGASHRDARAGGIAARNVAAALADARHIAETDDVRQSKGVVLLETLLQLLTEMRAIPETTALLPNYPNPFNPETWLPYQLSTPTEVTLSIYSIEGRLVRTLDLGHQPAGVYRSKHRAAYWDGKNQFGEKVASGVYFYTLSTESTRDSVTAGKFTATRKMLIAK